MLSPVRAVWIDRAGKRVRLEGGRELSYDRKRATLNKEKPSPLGWATRPRPETRTPTPDFLFLL